MKLLQTTSCLQELFRKRIVEQLTHHLSAKNSINIYMTDLNIKDCNENCREKYSSLAESDLIAKIIKLAPIENEFHLKANVPKEGLLAKLCAIECGHIEQGWGS